MGGRRRPPAHAGTANDQERIVRRLLGRAEARQRDPRLDAVDRDILNVIDRRTFLGYGDGRVGVKVLAEQVHRTTRTVRRHVARLECLGYVEVTERQRGHGGPAVNQYRVRSPDDRGPDAFRRRRSARQDRDAERKRRRSGRGVLTRTSPPPIRGRENARTGTGEQRRAGPSVPDGYGKRTRKGAAMPGRVVRTGERDSRREVEERWKRLAATAARLEPVSVPVQDAGAETDARRRVVDLVAAAQAAQARRLGLGPGAPWERGDAA